jgi:predicted metal-dependent hydrolase
VSFPAKAHLSVMTTTPLIILANLASPHAWAEAFTEQLGGGYPVATYTDRAETITHLTDDHAALIIVDGDQDGWQFWTTTPKASPATRRIPIILVSDSAETRAAALIAGADLALSTAELLKDATKLAADYARVIDPARAEQLACDCREPLPDLAEQGVEKFNAGEFYKQHDLFEALWMQTESPVRDLYRAILQVGVAYYQIERGNARGARKMLLRSVQWLSILPNECQGIDVQQLREESSRVRAALENMREEDIAQFDKTLLKPLKKAARHP